jgi:hypothetical protein
MTALISREPSVAEDNIWQSIGKATGWWGGAADENEGSDLTGMEAVSADDDEADLAKARAIPTDTLGSSNVTDIGGYVYDEERVPALMGSRRWVTFDAMLKETTIIATGVRAFLSLLSNTEWTINPAEDQEDNPRAQEIADIAYDAMFDMTTSWSAIVRKVSMFRFVGFSLMEWTAKMRDDGNIGFLDIEHRPQRSIVRWNRDASGTVESVVQQLALAGEVAIPIGKMIYAVDDMVSDSPEGMGLFRHLAGTHERLKVFLDLEETGFTTDLRGIPIARAPLGELNETVKNAAEGDAKTKAKAQRATKLQPLKDFIKKHIRNKKSGALLPSDTYQAVNADQANTPSAVYKWGLELLNGDSESFEDMAKAITRMNQEMARLLGVEHLLLGADGSGSLALAQSKVGTFYLNLTSTLRDLVEVFERDFLGPLAELNGWPPELIPSMAVAEISEVDVEMVSRVLLNLANAGAPMMPDDPAIGEVRDRAGVSRPPEDQVDRALDMSLNAQRNAANPDDPKEVNPEDQVTKMRMIKSRRGTARTKRAAQMRRAA